MQRAAGDRETGGGEIDGRVDRSQPFGMQRQRVEIGCLLRAAESGGDLIDIEDAEAEIERDVVGLLRLALGKRQRAGEIRLLQLALGRGEPLAQILKSLEVSEQTYYRWRHQFGGLKAPDAKRLKELKKENARLKKLVADMALDIEMLKEVAKGNF